MSTTAILDTSKFPFESGPLSGTGTVELLEYEPNYLKYRTSNQGDGFIVFSEIFYPKGWTATIDGNETDHVRVNYVLRGMMVPSGHHEIEFHFAPKTYALGNTLTTVFGILIVAGLLGGVFMAVRETQLQTSDF